MPTTNSILRYPGGKTAYASLLKEVIHLNGLKGYALAECFAGGAGASLKLLLNKEVPSIILNDYDPAIYSVWLATIRHSQQLIDWIEQVPITIESWKEQKKSTICRLVLHLNWVLPHYSSIVATVPVLFRLTLSEELGRKESTN